MEQWLSEGLSRILEFEVPDDLIQYILSIQNVTNLNEYLATLLDYNNSQHKDFVDEVIKRQFPAKGKKKSSRGKKQHEESSNSEVQQNITPKAEPEVKSKKKTKFINLYSTEGKNVQVVQLKGRHHCDCQASKHDLINNCLRCGRIVCKQEGSGPCLFCGNLVCTPEEQREINSKTKASAKLVESLMEQNRPKGWEAAVTHRNTLLEYDRTSERRTHVTDDDSDYFNTNSVWLSANERDKLQKYQQTLHEKKHASRLQKKMTFDFGGRQIIEDNTIDYDVDEDKIRQMADSGIARPSSGILRNDFETFENGDRDVAPGINASLLQFDSSAQWTTNTSSKPVISADCRVQDAEVQEMSDRGKCLSMHQPWASLLVEGIKMHEGRTWYTSHRGRLWIASTAKPPDTQIISAIENQYRALYPGKQVKFPTFYPTGCLLGCVNVDDCLPQEEYRKKYSDGESDSPYVFICSNPVNLRLRFPIQGQHKIYQLDKLIHQAAMKSIQKASKQQAQEASAG